MRERERTEGQRGGEGENREEQREGKRERENRGEQRGGVIFPCVDVRGPWLLCQTSSVFIVIEQTDSKMLVLMMQVKSTENAYSLSRPSAYTVTNGELGAVPSIICKVHAKNLFAQLAKHVHV